MCSHGQFGLHAGEARNKGGFFDSVQFGSAFFTLEQGQYARNHHLYMTIITKILKTFEHDGKEYEIREFRDGSSTKIQVYHNDEPANGDSYNVDWVHEFSIKKNLGVSAVESLRHSAKEDVINGYWEEYLAVLEQEEDI